MIKKVAFTLYPVIEMDRARTFYEGTLGLEVSSVGPGGKWVEYDLPGGGCFALTNMLPDFAPSSNQGGSIALEVEDIDSLMDELKTKGVEVKMEIFKSPVCKLSMILDPEGNSLIIHQIHPTKKG